MAHPSDILLIEYGGGRLPDPQRREVQTHLGQCPACSQRYRELEATRSLLGEWEAPADEPDLAEKVLQSIRADTSNVIEADPVLARIGSWPIVRIAASFAVAALLGCTAALLVRSSTQAPVLAGDADPQQALAELYLDVIVNDSPVGLYPVILTPPNPDGEV